MRDLLKTLVMEYKVCSLEYFMDKMAFWELPYILENLNICLKTEWLTTRQVVWSNLVPYSKKKLSPEDVMSFSFDKTDTQQSKVEVTQELVEKMKVIAEQNKKKLVKSGLL